MARKNLSNKRLKVKGKRLTKKTTKPKKSKVRSKKAVKSSKKGASASLMERMKDPKLSALCMKCFRTSGKKTRSRVMKLAKRTQKVTSRGVGMISGECSVCSGRMVVFVKN